MTDEHGHTGAPPQIGTNDLRRVLQPRSIAIVGFSQTPGSTGRRVLDNIQANQYQADVYLVGRSLDQVEGFKCFTSIGDAPRGIDVAVLTVPSRAVVEAVQACAGAGVKSFVIFASGFAEVGSHGLAMQQQLTHIARHHKLAILGPNSLGFMNYVDGLTLSFLPYPAISRIEQGPGIAIVSQSGGIMGALRVDLSSRGLPISYCISTGNEADIDLAAAITFLASDRHSGTIVAFAEHIRNPPRFLAACKDATGQGKSIVMLHSGRCEGARGAAKTHTGAIAGDYAVMSAKVKSAGVLLVDGPDELADVAELLTRYPKWPRGGLGAVSFSGALGAVIHDLAANAGLNLPNMSPAIEHSLRAVVTDAPSISNPMDLGTVPSTSPSLLRDCLIEMQADPAFGSILATLPLSGNPASYTYLEQVAAAASRSVKPVIVSSILGGPPLPKDAADLARASNVALLTSPERSIRALAVLTSAQPTPRPSEPQIMVDIPRAKEGLCGEYSTKQLLSSLGIQVPTGEVAQNLDGALAVAQRIGYPVALKAQIRGVIHKSDIGAVRLDLEDEAALRRAWSALSKEVEGRNFADRLDGVLVEKMIRGGIELLVGARNDADWGAYVLVGRGGYFAELFQDAQIIPAPMTLDDAHAALTKLSISAAFRGFRSLAPLDTAEAAKVIRLLGDVVAANTALADLEINPLVMLEEGKGVVALDATMITEDGAPSAPRAKPKGADGHRRT